VGAGLAGLAAARLLGGAGCDVVVLEASDGVRGRVRTDVADGDRPDRGFQVLRFKRRSQILDSVQKI
jgi:protoporphyrinogen oxidase